MNATLCLVVYMAIVTWLTLLAASVIRARGWTLSGMKIAAGNRDVLPEATPFSGRAERTARNTLEGFVLFTAIALVAQTAGVTHPNVAAGAELFFWARIVYIPVYYAGIAYLRTGVWLVSILGLAMMAIAVLQAEI
ncbi:MAG: MAPEG family protein [Pseudomonadota bacterium]